MKFYPIQEILMVLAKLPDNEGRKLKGRCGSGPLGEFSSADLRRFGISEQGVQAVEDQVRAVKGHAA